MAEEPDAAAQEGIGHRIVRAMFVVIFFQLFWKFGGLIITVLVGSVFQASPESDAYLFVSETVVFLLQTLCLKIFIPVVVPIFKEQMAERGEAAAWRFGSTVLCLTFGVLALVTVGGMVFAPRITAVIAEGFNDRQAFLTTRLMRIMFPGVLAICLATVTYALLNSYNIFGYAAAGDALQKMLWAGVFLAASLAGLAASKSTMLDVVAVAFLLGAAATIGTHLVGLRSKLRFLRPGLPGLGGRRVVIEAGILGAHLAVFAGGLWAVRRFAPARMHAALQQGVLVVVAAAYLLLLWWRARGRPSAMAKFAALSVPLLFGILFAKYRDVLTNLFASFTGTGVFSDLKYARKVGEAPNTLVIAALSIAILPHLCELATGKKWSEFGQVMTRTIRIVVIFFVPLAALTVVLRRPVIQLLFDRGTWDDYHLVRAGDALGLYILSLPFFAIENPIQQSFFAMQRMWTPTLIGFLGSGFHILFLYVGIEWLGFGYFLVVALVYASARAFKNVILLLVMRVHVKILPWKETLVFLGKAAVITAAIVAVAHFTHVPLRQALPLEPYRTRQVMLDTFNVEPRGWESENVDEFAIEPAATLEVSHPRIQDNALVARYRPTTRRFAGLRRDLSGFDLTHATALTFDVATGWRRTLRIQLVTRDGTAHDVGHYASSSTDLGTVAVKLDEESTRSLLPDVVALWVLDTTPHGEGLGGGRRADLVLDNLALRLGDATVVVIDDFAGTAATWEGGAVQDTKEREPEPELALRVRPGGSYVRRLDAFAVEHCDRLRFKAKAEKPVTLRVRRRAVRDGRTAETVGEATVDVAASAGRKTYAVAVGEWFRGASANASAADGWRLEVDAPAGGGFWLDNVAFVREPEGPRFGSIALMYEAGKLVHVGVPALAALVVFVILLIVLRVEDAESIWAWMRQRVLGRLAARFGRGK